jgi:predicted protein tyrosine phosphatase
MTTQHLIQIFNYMHFLLPDELKTFCIFSSCELETIDLPFQEFKNHRFDLEIHFNSIHLFHLIQDIETIMKDRGYKVNCFTKSGNDSSSSSKIIGCIFCPPSQTNDDFLAIDGTDYFAPLHQITNRIYLGNEQALKQITDCNHITHIINASGRTKFSKPLRELGICVWDIYIEDDEDQDISFYFEMVFIFIEKALAQKSNNYILIVCKAGVSRSATLLLAWFIQKLTPQHNDEDINAMEHVNRLIAYVKSKRHIIDPNDGFYHQLKQLAIKTTKI